MAEFATYLSGMKTLLLFIGTVLRSRIIQRKGLGAIPAIYKLILHWWSWTPLQPEAQVSGVSEYQEQSLGVAPAERVELLAQRKVLVGLF